MNPPLQPPLPLPAVVIGGYLGAGKTTLVNHLLRHAGGRRIAVLVNDFGEINIDAELIEGGSALAGEVLSLAGGCICCSFGADLVGALARLQQRRPRPDLVLIETSGVGLPAAVARTAKLAPGMRIEGIVVLADASLLRRQAAERYVGETVRQQLREADLVLVGKTDLVDAAALAELTAWLREGGLSAPVVPAQFGEVAPEVVLGLLAVDADAAPADAGQWHFAPRGLSAAGIAAAARYVATTRHFEQAVDVAALGAELVRNGILRAKGLLLDSSGRWQELHVVGPRVDMRPWRGPSATGTGVDAAAGAASAAGRLVTISLRDG